MKKSILFLVPFLVLISCSKEDTVNPFVKPDKSNREEWQRDYTSVSIVHDEDLVFDSEKDYIEKTIYRYDGEVGRTFQESDGSLYSITTSQYSATGFILFSEVYIVDYDISTYKYEYDEQGRILKEYKYYSDAEIEYVSEYYEYVYDDSNNTCVKTFYDWEGTVRGVENIQFDSHGNTLKREIRSRTGQLGETHEYEYDENDRLVLWVHVNKYVKSVNEYTYPESNVMNTSISEINLSDNKVRFRSTITTTTTYD